MVVRLRRQFIVDFSERVECGSDLENLLHPVLNHVLHTAVMVEAEHRQIIQVAFDIALIVDVVPDIVHQAIEGDGLIQFEVGPVLVEVVPLQSRLFVQAGLWDLVEKVLVEATMETLEAATDRLNILVNAPHVLEAIDVVLGPRKAIARISGHAADVSLLLRGGGIRANIILRGS